MTNIGLGACGPSFRRRSGAGDLLTKGTPDAWKEFNYIVGSDVAVVDSKQTMGDQLGDALFYADIGDWTRFGRVVLGKR